MSWLVAPRCTSPERSRSLRTSGSTGLPARRPSRASCSTSSPSTAKTSSPRSSACARASARSAASIARSHASSSSAARSSSGTNSASNGKEHRLPLALQADVERERAVLPLRVGQVDARELVPQQAACEDVCLDVASVRRDEKREAAFGVGAATAPAIGSRRRRPRSRRRRPAPPARRAAGPTSRAPSGTSSFCGRRQSPIVKNGPTVCDGVRGASRSPPASAGAAAEDDVPPVAERPLRLRRVEVEAATSSARDFGSRTALKIGS